MAKDNTERYRRAAGRAYIRRELLREASEPLSSQVTSES